MDLSKQHHPDLVLMDMMMPIVSGYEAVAEIKGDPATNDITIVGLSAKAMATDMERATDVGIDGYITKPFRIAQVLSVVQELPAVVAAGGRAVARLGNGQEPAADRRISHQDYGYASSITAAPHDLRRRRRHATAMQHLLRPLPPLHTGPP